MQRFSLQPSSAGAAEVLGGQVEALERRAGGAVEDEDALVERLEQRRGARLGIWIERPERAPPEVVG